MLHFKIFMKYKAIKKKPHSNIVISARALDSIIPLLLCLGDEKYFVPIGLDGKEKSETRRPKHFPPEGGRSERI